ncbi:MAG: Fur family transcriptional regulator [Gemmatimonadota bacterium]|nr:Fur family transcriptional regulator [Gemmatimonadota bacterium]
MHPPAAESRLHEAGLRATRPRLAVYAHLREAGGHHSVDDIARRLAKAGEPLPRQTVYNVVADLTAAGLLMCADAGPGRALYEAAEEWHHHFVCRRCATIIDVPCTRGRKPCLDAPAGLGLQIDEAQVIFRGLCPACRGEPDAA